MKEANRINDLKDQKILLFIWVLSIYSLQFKVMKKRILNSLQLLDYKLIASSIFEKFAPIKFYNIRRLTDSHNSYFFDGFCFVSTQSESLRTDFLFSTRFSTPKMTPPTPTPTTSYTSLNSFHSSIMFKALLSKSSVN